jgi:serine phosphatase RsbU (regulator of sigma subunit)
MTVTNSVSRDSSLIERKQGEPAASVVQAVNEELERFTHGARAADDVTLVVVRCCCSREQSIPQ